MAKRTFEYQMDLEEDGRWIVEIASLPGVMAYGNTAIQALSRAEAIALRVIADEIEETQIAPAELSFSCA